MNKRARLALFYRLNIWRQDQTVPQPPAPAFEEEWWGGVALRGVAVLVLAAALASSAHAASASRRIQLQDEIPAGSLYGQAEEVLWRPRAIQAVRHAFLPPWTWEQHEPAGSLHGPPDEQAHWISRPWPQRPPSRPFQVEDDLPVAAAAALDDGARITAVAWRLAAPAQPRLLEDDLPPQPVLAHEDYAWPLPQAKAPAWQRAPFTWQDEVQVAPPDEQAWIPGAQRPWLPAPPPARFWEWQPLPSAAPGLDEDVWAPPGPWPQPFALLPPWFYAGEEYAVAVAVEANVGIPVHAIPGRLGHTIPERPGHAAPERPGHAAPGRPGHTIPERPGHRMPGR